MQNTKKESELTMDSEDFRYQFVLNFLEELDRDADLNAALKDISSPLFPAWFFKFVISFFVSIEVSDDDARTHFINILNRRQQLKGLNNQSLDFRVVAFDYFLNEAKLLINPIFMETEFFEEIYNFSQEDPKTGLYNARLFKESVKREITRAERHNLSLSIILIDLDNFKYINDTWGHLFGDEMLIKFSDVMKENIRGEDVICRFGGDEFAILMPQTGRIGARSMGERMKYRLSQTFRDVEKNGTKVTVTFSAGIATFPYDAKDYESLVRVADEALYRSKFLGKNMIFDKLSSTQYNDFVSGKEKRKFPRIVLHKENQVSVLNGSELMEVRSRILDISRGGVFMQCVANLLPELLSKELKLNLNLPGKDTEIALPLDGLIRRVNYESSRITFFIAMEFAEPLSENEWNVIIERSSIGK